MICVDASVAAKWAFAEEHSTQARALLRDALDRQEPIVAPPLLLSEIANVIYQRMRQGHVQLEEARALLAHVLTLPITLSMPEMVYDRSLALASRYKLPAIYDALYVALAEILGITLWTADQRLLRLVGGRLSFVRSIADYRA